MKTRILPFIILISLLSLNFICIAQSNVNLVPNHSFEDAHTGHSPGCKYGQPINQQANEFDSDIYDWKVARHKKGKGFVVPFWVDTTVATCMQYTIYSLCTEGRPPIFPSKRFIMLDRRWWTGTTGNPKFKYGAIRVELNDIPLVPEATYIIRMKVIPVRQFSEGISFGENSHLRVFLTKFGEKWYKKPKNDISKSSSNQRFEAVNANVVLPWDVNCSKWQFLERRFTVPSDHDQLKNLVLLAEENRMAIDDVELYRECPDKILVQNQDYHGSIYHTGANQGYDFINHAANTIIAGRNVGAPIATGDVVVRDDADVTFRAGNRIELLPGFSTELGAKFIAEISPCAGNGKKGDDEGNDNDTTAISSPEPNNEPYDEPQPNDINTATAITIHPNPTSGEFTIQGNFTLPATIELYDLTGRQVFRQAVMSNRQQVDVSRLAGGLYVYRLISDGKVARGKIILK